MLRFVAATTTAVSATNQPINAGIMALSLCRCACCLKQRVENEHAHALELMPEPRQEVCKLVVTRSLKGSDPISKIVASYMSPEEEEHGDSWLGWAAALARAAWPHALLMCAGARNSEEM